MKRLINLKVLLLSLLLASATGCTKSQTNDDGNAGTPGNSDGGNVKGAFETNCGTVSGGKLSNPASPGDGFQSQITVIGANLLSVTLPSGPLLVKLHGIRAPYSDTQIAAAKSMLESLATEPGIFIPADSECSASLSNQDSGALGQVFTLSGQSYSETLISRGLVDIEQDYCGGDLIYSCYSALQEDASSKYAGEVGRLLWKPVSDSNGKLAIHTGPYGTTVKVNGETGTNQGGGNGYGSLARFSKPGCAYGSNVQVQVFNENGAAYTFNGSTTITIPSGCSRTCVEGSTLAQCSKS